MNYSKAICNELGEVVAYCKGMTNEEIRKMLNEHEEYSLRCIKEELL